MKQPNNSMAAASPAARTPPQAPRVRALKRLTQTKNRCCGECTPNMALSLRRWPDCFLAELLTGCQSC